MKYSTFSTLAVLTGLSAAAPVKREAQAPAAPDQMAPPQQAAPAAMGNQDVTILQFALTLEHLENVFYKQALQKFKQEDFRAAGFAEDHFTNLQFLVEDEQSHVQLLTKAIEGAGQKPAAACKYNFPITDVASFVTLSSILEGVGTSAYLGAAGLVQDKKILGTAGSILAVEALHTSQQRQALGELPAPNALYTPVGANGIFTLASQFIVECPPDNPQLPFKAFPKLTGPAANCADQAMDQKKDVMASPPSEGSSGSMPMSEQKMSGGSPPSYKARRQEQKMAEIQLSPPHPNEIAELTMPDAPDAIAVIASGPQADEAKVSTHSSEALALCAPSVAGDMVKFKADSPMSQGAMLTFVSGLDVTSVPAQMNGAEMQAQIPDTAKGQVYVFATNGPQQGEVDDKAVLAGPAIIEVGPPKPNIDQNVL